MSSSGYNPSEPCSANTFSQRDFFCMIGGIMFGCILNSVLWPGPLLVRTPGMMPWLGRAADGGCSQFVPDYSFRRKWDSSDGELEHPVLL